MARYSIPRTAKKIYAATARYADAFETQKSQAGQRTAVRIRHINSQRLFVVYHWEAPTA